MVNSVDHCDSVHMLEKRLCIASRMASHELHHVYYNNCSVTERKTLQNVVKMDTNHPDLAPLLEKHFKEESEKNVFGIVSDCCHSSHEVFNALCHLDEDILPLNEVEPECVTASHGLFYTL